LRLVSAKDKLTQYVSRVKVLTQFGGVDVFPGGRRRSRAANSGRPILPLLHQLATDCLNEEQQDVLSSRPHIHTHTHPFNDPLSATTRVGQYQKGKTNLDFTEARDSEWQWHQLDHMQVCTSLQADNHASTPPLSFLQARCPSCRPTNSVKALKAP